MQNRYTGDIGDFAKYGILRALSEDYKLGIAWYLFPDEGHNADGKHLAYLDQPAKWRHLDPELFDGLRAIVNSEQRTVSAVETSGLLRSSSFSGQPLQFNGSPDGRKQARQAWFRRVLSDLNNCNLVFADPDNGLCANEKYHPAQVAFWKRMPLSEALALASGRTAIIYHHNSRFPGGHAQEIQHWLEHFGGDAFALYWRAFSNRTFFVVNPTAEIRQRSSELVRKWSPHLELRPFDG